jgi:hypothetical protein
MHKVTFFSLGNADSCLIELEKGKKILFDYANTRDPEDDKDLRCDLEKEIRDRVKDNLNVVAFTHLDIDHIKGATELFWLEHAKKYQDEDRIKINTLWVPAAVITEPSPDDDEAKVIQKEARYRFKAGEGIRVFSRPSKLKEWCEKNEIDFDSRKNLITDAGKLAPEFDKNKDGIEFFVHSPFAKRLNEEEVEDRNNDSLVMQAIFSVEGIDTKMLLMADIGYEIIIDIIEVTKDIKKRPERLEWDICKIPHHCSYNSLGPEKGDEKTKPVKGVKWLYEDNGLNKCRLISSSKPIPEKDTEEDKDSQPPHRQAAAYYKDVAEHHKGEFLVTMEEPSKTSPKPIIIEINSKKARVVKAGAWGGSIAVSKPAPRAGSYA